MTASRGKDGRLIAIRGDCGHLAALRGVYGQFSETAEAERPERVWSGGRHLLPPEPEHPPEVGLWTRPCESGRGVTKGGGSEREPG